MMLLLLALAAGVQDASAPPRPIDPGSWITPQDYPAPAIRAGESGMVGFALEVSSEGNVKSCQVTATSGSVTLDQVTCVLLTERAHFTPAKDNLGRPIPSTFRSRLRWDLPTPPPPPTEQPAPGGE